MKGLARAEGVVGKAAEKGFGAVVTGIVNNTSITLSRAIGTTAVAADVANLTFNAVTGFTGNVTVAGGTM